MYTKLDVCHNTLCCCRQSSHFASRADVFPCRDVCPLCDSAFWPFLSSGAPWWFAQACLSTLSYAHEIWRWQLRCHWKTSQLCLKALTEVSAGLLVPCGCLDALTDAALPHLCRLKERLAGLKVVVFFFFFPWGYYKTSILYNTSRYINPRQLTTVCSHEKKCL